MSKASHKGIKLQVVDDRPLTPCCPGEQPAVSPVNISEANWVVGQLETNTGPVYRVATALDRSDLWGAVKARWGVGRMNYTVPPGLYAIGAPDENAAVLVSANYKLSFDSLRRELSGLNLWLLVLDTNGINVWCAAGKGSFGTAEVARMVGRTGLARLVSHRTLILPQLAAPGVAAHEVRRRCGFNVVYGPVRAADLPAFLRAGNKADAAMRRPSFTLRDRLVLTPLELTSLIKPLSGFALFLFLLNLSAALLKGNPLALLPLLGHTIDHLVPFVVAVLVGAVLVPALLPYLPGRALAWKGLVLGVLWAFAYTALTPGAESWLRNTAHFLIIPSITAFIGLNFTGSTTYTSLSGVIKETKIAFPLIAMAAGLGLIALVAAYFV